MMASRDQFRPQIAIAVQNVISGLEKLITVKSEGVVLHYHMTSSSKIFFGFSQKQTRKIRET